MSRQVLEIEQLLRQLVTEHRKLLGHVQQHEQAMRLMNLAEMDQTSRLQEAARARIAAMETRRRTAVGQLARMHRIAGTIDLQRIAELYPAQRPTLLALRDELKLLAGQIAGRLYIASRLAGTILGHLNTAVRLLAGATDRSGVYTRSGAPQVSRRAGVMNAVG